MVMLTVNAMIHSLGAQDEAVILHEKRNNDVIVEYKGIRCSAIFNPFTGMYYVDDLYSVLPDQNRCPKCGEYIA